MRSVGRRRPRRESHRQRHDTVAYVQHARVRPRAGWLLAVGWNVAEDGEGGVMDREFRAVIWYRRGDGVVSDVIASNRQIYDAIMHAFWLAGVEILSETRQERAA